jgi:hypothetical protein
MTEASGGCQCGRVRYTVDLAEAEAYLCHCTMCRKATGGASIAFVGVPMAAVRFGTAPDWYRSSPIAERPFCSACGTPLGFRFLDNTTTMDLTLGSFDDTSGFVPTHNYAAESILPAWQNTAHLPGKRTEDNPNVADRWIKTVGKLPD